MMRWTIAVAALALVTPAVAAPCELSACKCYAAGIDPNSPDFVRGQRDQAERVVLGTVTRFDTVTLPSHDWRPAYEWRVVVARVKVQRVWRGSLADTMSVMVGNVGGHSDCDLRMGAGQSYLIFATRMEDGTLTTHKCSGTLAEREATDVITVLGEGQPARTGDR